MCNPMVQNELILSESNDFFTQLEFNVQSFTNVTKKIIFTMCSQVLPQN